MGDCTWVFVAADHIPSRAVGLISKQNVSGLPRETGIYGNCVFLKLEGMQTLAMVGAEHGVPPPTLHTYQTAKVYTTAAKFDELWSSHCVWPSRTVSAVPGCLWFL